MPQTVALNTRIESELKTQAERLLKSLGLSHSDAISMFYRQVVLQGGLPIELKAPNGETVAAMQEERSILKIYDSAEKLLTDLNS